MTLPTIPESIYDAAVNTYFASSHGMRRSILAALNAVWPDLHALAVASLPAAPTVLSDREAIASAILGRTPFAAADAVLALLAETITPWKRVEPGTVIKAGTRYRIEWFDQGAISAMERTNTYDITIDPTDPARWYIDPRTAPADPAEPN